MKDIDINEVVSIVEGIAGFYMPASEFYKQNFSEEDIYRFDIGIPERLAVLANDYSDGSYCAEDMVYEAMRIGTFVIAERVISKLSGTDPSELRKLALQINDQKLAPVSDAFRTYLWLSGTLAFSDPGEAE